MFELSGVNYEEVLEQGDSILVRVIASSSYRGFELSRVRVIAGSSYRDYTVVYMSYYFISFWEIAKYFSSVLYIFFTLQVNKF